MTEWWEAIGAWKSWQQLIVGLLAATWWQLASMA